MVENRMSFLSGALLWVGAAISIAEILTGAALAPLGFGMGVLAIVAGHLIGCILFYFAGFIGAKSKLSAMESVGLSFGRYGSVFFSVLNVLQLIGWTAVMIIMGAKAFGSVASNNAILSNNMLWCVVIGLLVIVWIAAGLKNAGKLNLVAVGGLFILSIVLGALVLKGGGTAEVSEAMSFGLALELSIAMPISWLPLISDYTRNTDKPVSFTLVSTASYFLASTFMYIIGLGAAVFAGTSDIVKILVAAGLGSAAMLIVILSTVTTTFLDVYSAGESILNIHPKLNGKVIGIIISVVGTLIAMFTPIEQYQNFLMLISSVFVPMATILITDYFILKKRSDHRKIDILNAVLWVVGFILYRIFLNTDTVLGSTIPVILMTAALCILTNFIAKKVVMKSV